MKPLRSYLVLVTTRRVLLIDAPSETEAAAQARKLPPPNQSPLMRTIGRTLEVDTVVRILDSRRARTTHRR